MAARLLMVVLVVVVLGVVGVAVWLAMQPSTPASSSAAAPTAPNAVALLLTPERQRISTSWNPDPRGYEASRAAGYAQAAAEFAR